VAATAATGASVDHLTAALLPPTLPAMRGRPGRRTLRRKAW